VVEFKTADHSIRFLKAFIQHAIFPPAIFLGTIISSVELEVHGESRKNGLATLD
jgi:hypothetical protein